jgi:hypothetical protein
MHEETGMARGGKGSRSVTVKIGCGRDFCQSLMSGRRRTEGGGKRFKHAFDGEPRPDRMLSI